jgi:hypothetical protein
MQMIPGADDVIVNEAEVVASGTGWDIDSLNSIEGIVKAEMRIARTKRWCARRDSNLRRLGGVSEAGASCRNPEQSEGSPIASANETLVRPERFELPTCCSGGNRSIQLSYGRIASIIHFSTQGFACSKNKKRPNKKSRELFQKRTRGLSKTSLQS